MMPPLYLNKELKMKNKDKDNIVQFPKSSRVESILRMIQEGQLGPIKPTTAVQNKITHLQGQIGALWLSIPDQGEVTDDPQPWEPWMLKSIVQTLNELDKFLVDWYRDEDR